MATLISTLLHFSANFQFFGQIWFPSSKFQLKIWDSQSENTIVAFPSVCSEWAKGNRWSGAAPQDYAKGVIMFEGEASQAVRQSWVNQLTETGAFYLKPWYYPLVNQPFEIKRPRFSWSKSQAAEQLVQKLKSRLTDSEFSFWTRNLDWRSVQSSQNNHS